MKDIWKIMFGVAGGIALPACSAFAMLNWLLGSKISTRK